MSSVSNLTREEFLKDVARHEMQILKDEENYRHIRFKKPGSYDRYFDLVTWPGSLIYTGDMGTFSFSRLADMFEFFRRSKKDYAIDHRYWAEKLTAVDKSGGVEEFNSAAVIRRLTVQRRELFVEHADGMNASERQEFWDSLQDIIDNVDSYQEAIWSQISDWSLVFNTVHRATSIGLDLMDFSHCKRYTYRFLWCCEALAWGIKMYDDHKKAIT